MTVGFAYVYPLDSNLFGGQNYPPFEQPKPDVYVKLVWNLESHFLYFTIA